MNPDQPRRILVGLKRVVDYNVRVHPLPDGSGIALDGVKMSVNPFCEIALEQALRLREQGHADEIIVVAVGPAEARQQLRTGLAMGADRAVLVQTALEPEPLTVARIFHALVRREAPLLVLLGKQAIDSDNNQTGQMLAAIWDRPQATFASSLEFGDSTIVVEREVDQGTEVLELELPAVVTADLRLNEPRFVKLPQLLKAKKMPIETLAPEALGCEPAPGQFTVIEVLPPAERAAGVQVDSVDALLRQLADRKLI
jgi:electron transfer flavoprotein beta subunit